MLLPTLLRTACLWSLSSAARFLERIERRRGDGSIPHFRAAIVKQATYWDLFTRPRAASPLDVIVSSRHRSGPVGLIHDLQADCFIVRPEKDSECRVWEEKGQHIRYAGWTDHYLRQMDVAVGAADVNWSDYDLVLAIENAVPARVTRAHPGTVWATMVEHHRMRAYQAYLKAPPPGYDLFFNQRFGPTATGLFRRPHVIEWPYVFSRGASIAELLPDKGAEDRVVLEANQPKELVEVVRRKAGLQAEMCGARSLRDHLELLRTSRFFFAPKSDRSLWGNAAVEAVSSGCVAVANRADLWNPGVIPPALHCSDVDQGIRIVRKLIEDRSFLDVMRARQRALVDWCCFHRPFNQVAAATGWMGREVRLSRLIDEKRVVDETG